MTDTDHSPDEARRILRARAEALARPREAAGRRSHACAVLVIPLGGERYGIETSHVVEVLPLRGVVPVPHTPPFVVGVVNHSGRIIAVLDLGRLLRASERHPSDARGWVAVVESRGVTVGFVADAVPSIVEVVIDELVSPPATVSETARRWIRGMTAELVAVLDADALLADSQIVVNDQTR